MSFARSRFAQLRWRHLRWLGCFLIVLASCAGAWAQTDQLSLPELNLPDIKIEPSKDIHLPPNMQLMFFMTSLGLIPYFVVSCTAWIRISITMSYLKSALGGTQALSNQLMMGLNMIITMFIMYPVGQRINEVAFQPYLKGDIQQVEFVEKGAEPMREWMFKQTRDSDIALFLHFSHYREHPTKPDHKPWPKTLKDIPFVVLYTGFIMSEVKTGFMIGFMIYIPFLIIDMIVAGTLMSMGMMMIPSSSISLPFKLLMWCRIDGWHLVIKGLMYSFNRPDWMGPAPRI